MVDHCANTKCKKPLHYLREGTIYIFEEADAAGGVANPFSHRLEHYWLCGECSASHLLERGPNKELRLIAKQRSRFVRQPTEVAEGALVS